MPAHIARAQPQALGNPSTDRAHLRLPKDKIGLFIRTIGLARARTKIGLANLLYNMKRLTWLARTASLA